MNEAEPRGAASEVRAHYRCRAAKSKTKEGKNGFFALAGSLAATPALRPESGHHYLGQASSANRDYQPALRAARNRGQDPVKKCRVGRSTPVRSGS
jgi:hypothetical protein